MSLTYHTKNLYVDTTNTKLVTSTGTKIDDPVFFYKDNLMLNWIIRDNNQSAIDLTGGTFEFKIAGEYNDEILVIIADGDFVKTGIAVGEISCPVDMDQGAVLTFVDLLLSNDAHASLWMTLGGVDYLLVAFNPTIRNIIF